MEWQDEGLIIGMSPWKEKAAITHIFTRSHGVWSGISGRKGIQVGLRVKGHWRARLESQLGFWKLETVFWPPFVHILQNSKALQALLTVCALCHQGLPERQSYSALYQISLTFLDQLIMPIWPIYYPLFEADFLRELGYGLGEENYATLKTQGEKIVSQEEVEATVLKMSLGSQKKSGPSDIFCSRSLQLALQLTGNRLRQHVFGSKGLPLTRGLLLTALFSKNSSHSF